MKNKTALYLRLSHDDGTSINSESIQNQKDFLLDYAKEYNFNVIKIFIDDGYSGINFDRPGFNEMIKLIERGGIDTIITKDLSRLGRDYIKIGEYLERYFPVKKIRYIAVNDGIDTFTNTNDLTPFRAVFNDMYAKDISKKVKTALMTKRLNGKFIGSVAPYGYIKDPIDKNHLIIDKETACVVNMIFNKFLCGCSIKSIANELSDMGIPTPYYQKKINKCQSVYKGIWSDVTIKRILSNPTYAGNLTQNITRKVNYKVKKRERLSHDEWITIDNTHEGIVNQEMFNTVNEMLSKRNYQKTNRRGKQHLFSGLVYCKDCNRRMTFVNESQKRVYLVCSGWRRNVEICKSHCIREELVKDKIIDMLNKIKKTIDIFQIVENIKKTQNHFNTNDEILVLEQKIDGYRALMLKLYKDKFNGIIDENDYIELYNTMKSERNIYEKKIQILKADKIELNFHKINDQIERIINFESIDRNVLCFLIDKIYIHEDKSIEIVFNFSNPFEEN